MRSISAGPCRPSTSPGQLSTSVVVMSWPPCSTPGDQQRRAVGARGVHGRAVAGGAGAEDDEAAVPGARHGHRVRSTRSGRRAHGRAKPYNRAAVYLYRSKELDELAESSAPARGCVALHSGRQPRPARERRHRHRRGGAGAVRGARSPTARTIPASRSPAAAAPRCTTASGRSAPGSPTCCSSCSGVRPSCSR